MIRVGQADSNGPTKGDILNASNTAADWWEDLIFSNETANYLLVLVITKDEREKNLKIENEKCLILHNDRFLNLSCVGRLLDWIPRRAWARGSDIFSPLGVGMKKDDDDRDDYDEDGDEWDEFIWS